MPRNALLAISVLVFGLLVIALEVFVMLRRNRGWGLQSSRTIGISLIVVSALFLASADLALDRVTPVIGMLGTVAGYLLGKSDSGGSNE